MKIYERFSGIEYCIETSESENGEVWICEISDFNILYSVKKGDIKSRSIKGRVMIKMYLKYLN